MKIRSWLIEFGLPITLAVFTGILGTLFVQSKDAATAATAQVKKLEAEVRTATGKYLDQQERNEDAQSATKPRRRSRLAGRASSEAPPLVRRPAPSLVQP
jgi:hypothetical protein